MRAFPPFAADVPYFWRQFQMSSVWGRSFIYRLARLSAVHDLVFSVIVFVLRFPTSLQGSLRFLRFLLFLLFTGQAPVDILVSP
ncbi:Hypothetical predicted protein [Lynx pardinus]|uniref:Uncharacterized protein n=1 Tax=Lynx pardinus TaxID=191816 RepID=A0A485MQP1_LYNPA|nr:Hypothetical predicted protein [Lynx pardinus]